MSIEVFKNEGVLRVCLMENYKTINDIRKDDTEGIQTAKITGPGELTKEELKSKFCLLHTYFVLQLNEVVN